MVHAKRASRPKPPHIPPYLETGGTSLRIGRDKMSARLTILAHSRYFSINIVPLSLRKEISEKVTVWNMFGLVLIAAETATPM